MYCKNNLTFEKSYDFWEIVSTFTIENEHTIENDCWAIHWGNFRLKCIEKKGWLVRNCISTNTWFCTHKYVPPNLCWRESWPKRFYVYICMIMCICVTYVYMYMYLYVNMHIYVYTCIYTIYTHVYIHKYKYLLFFWCVYVWINRQISAEGKIG